MRRAVPAAVLAVLAAGGAAVSATASDRPTPPSGAAPVTAQALAKTAITLGVSPSKTLTGKSVTLSGVAGTVRASGRITPLKNARITLQYHVRGTTGWTTIRAFTAPAGTYKLTWRYPLRTSSSVRALLAATSTTASASSTARSITRIAPLPKPRAYPNCTALNKVYPHGVGVPGARDHTSGTPVTTFTRDAATYKLNTGRDRDKDKIACEKR